MPSIVRIKNRNNHLCLAIGPLIGVGMVLEEGSWDMEEALNE